MQNDSSNVHEFCGGLKRSPCETTEGIIIILHFRLL